MSPDTPSRLSFHPGSPAAPLAAQRSRSHRHTHTPVTGPTALGAGMRSKERSTAGGTWSRALGQQARDRHGSRALTAAAPQRAEEEERSHFHRPQGHGAGQQQAEVFLPSLPSGSKCCWPGLSPSGCQPRPQPFLKPCKNRPRGLPASGVFPEGVSRFVQSSAPTRLCSPMPRRPAGLLLHRTPLAPSGRQWCPKTCSGPRPCPALPAPRLAAVQGLLRCCQQAGTPQNTGI